MSGCREKNRGKVVGGERLRRWLPRKGVWRASGGWHRPGHAVGVWVKGHVYSPPHFPLLPHPSCPLSPSKTGSQEKWANWGCLRTCACSGAVGDPALEEPWSGSWPRQVPPMTRLSVAGSSDQRGGERLGEGSKSPSALSLDKKERGASCGRRCSRTSSPWLHSALRTRVRSEEGNSVPKTVVETLKTSWPWTQRRVEEGRKGSWIFSGESFWPEEADSEKWNDFFFLITASTKCFSKPSFHFRKRSRPGVTASGGRLETDLSEYERSLFKVFFKSSTFPSNFQREAHNNSHFSGLSRNFKVWPNWALADCRQGARTRKSWPPLQGAGAVSSPQPHVSLLTPNTKIFFFYLACVPHFCPLPGPSRILNFLC